MALTQSVPVPEDDIAAEYVAGLSAEELAAEFPDGIPGVAGGPGAAGLARWVGGEVRDWSSGPSDKRAGATSDRAPSPGLAPLSLRRPRDPRDLVAAAEQIRPTSLAREKVLPVVPGLAGLLPEGLTRGTTVAVGSGAGSAMASGLVNAPGATTLALALAAGASAHGSWVATVGLAQVGLATAVEAGLALERLAVISAPPPDQWATVVAALVGAFDIVLVGPPPAGATGEIRRLVARARERGAVLIQLDAPPPIGSRSRSPGSGSSSRAGSGRSLEIDLRVTVAGVVWSGLGDGHGHLRTRRLTVEVQGRRGAARPRRADLWLFDADGQLTAAEVSAVESTDAGPFAGSDVDQLDEARRGRIRRVARQPLDPARRRGTDDPSVAAVRTAESWSDAG